jgi:hypothetical protein
VSGHGFWLFLDEREHFVSFDQFPWFRDASIAALCNVERASAHHLFWPDLDVDLATESILHPDRFPLVSQVRPKKSPRAADKRLQRARAKALAPRPPRGARR